MAMSMLLMLIIVVKNDPEWQILSLARRGKIVCFKHHASKAFAIVLTQMIHLNDL